MRRRLAMLATVAAACVVNPAHAQNRIASGSTYHTVEPQNVMPYSIWTNCVLWLTACQNPSNNAAWTCQSYGNEAATRNNGTNGTASTRPAWSARAVTFDGVDDYIVAADSASLSPTAAITISAWVKPTSSSANQFFVTKRVGYQNAASYALVTQGDGLCQFGISPAGGAGISARSSAVMPLNAWTHFVGVFSASTTLKIYTNAVNATSDLYSDAGTGGQSPPASVYDSGAYLVIGAINNPPAAPMNGKISDIAIFNRALSATEITNLYNATKSPTPARP